MATMHVALVSPERELWSGEAASLFARTLEGELGILPNHAPLFGALVDGGVVRIDAESGSVTAAVQGGFLSVADNKVSVLAEWAQFADDVDVDAVRAELADAEAAGDDPAAVKRARRARAQLKAAGQHE